MAKVKKAKHDETGAEIHDASGAVVTEEVEDSGGDESPQVECVTLIRDEYDENREKRTGPLSAQVHPDEVQNWLDANHGWKHAE